MSSSHIVWVSCLRVICFISSITCIIIVIHPLTSLLPPKSKGASTMGTTRIINVTRSMKDEYIGLYIAIRNSDRKRKHRHSKFMTGIFTYINTDNSLSNRQIQYLQELQKRYDNFHIPYYGEIDYIFDLIIGNEVCGISNPNDIIDSLVNDYHQSIEKPNLTQQEKDRVKYLRKKYPEDANMKSHHLLTKYPKKKAMNEMDRKRKQREKERQELNKILQLIK